MQRNIKIYIALFSVSLLLFGSCKKDYGDLNGETIEDLTKNASQAQLNNLVSGTESGLRNSLNFYLDDVSIIGRETYRFSNSEPRYVLDMLGANGATLNGANFYITFPWASRYRVVKNCNTLIQAANNSTLISNAQKAGYIGFARTIKAYQLLLNLNLTYDNGIRVNVADPTHLGPFVSYTDGLAAITALLDSAKTDLSNASISFQLAGFTGLDDAAGLTKFNRALAARVSLYQTNWQTALDNVNASFLNLNGSFNTGVYHIFGTGSGDQLNPVFIPQNQTGEVRVAHPSYAADLAAGDDRINKTSLRSTAASLSGLSSNRDVWLYTSSTAPVSIIRNEELILIYAEANIQLGNFNTAISALNTIRNGHGLGNYSGAVNKNALITEMLNQRRYSLFFEGHRWIDLRRYNLLNTLPIDRTGDQVWSKFPLPVTEH
ncbi:RagB/SusD family nutrient uptake outer membrane protein [Mucilaginibacter sp. BT774]|uniref:RagB/SusD family nutrient uptake outer membrane protein n=1 Tax=Mucilaginibacter sp. BT774 TaxID=3062276 RepID=UPI002676250B|nr:RagB/SusD family nutrient uptake outer membrane protein [Mucilaginibacter sp. BT774]MDO3628034.1 RagB/SusD family nutrient uptake outer membrane protein [Mucilaginibacter sp. BT774]